jgi:hypothetical protein
VIVRTAHATEPLTATKETKTMIARLGPLAALLACAALLCAATAPAAQAAPKWKLHAANNTTVAPEAELGFHLNAHNLGDEKTAGPYKILATLPPGFTATAAEGELGFPFSCTILTAETVKCEASETRLPGESARLLIRAKAPAAQGTQTAHFTVEEGNAPEPNSTTAPVTVTASLPAFDLAAFDAQPADEAGTALSSAGAHPDSYASDISVATHTDPVLGSLTGEAEAVEPFKDATVELPAGLVGNPASVPQCTLAELANTAEGATSKSLCASVSQVGTVSLLMNSAPFFYATHPIPVYNLAPPPGVAARFGVNAAGVVVLVDTTLRSSDYTLVARSRDNSEGLPITGAEFDFWGVPSASSHDPERACPGQGDPFDSGIHCTSGAPPVPFFRLPTSCAGPQATTAHADSWFHPGAVDPLGEPVLSDPAWKSRASVSHALPGYPATPGEWGAAEGITGCDKVPVKGKLGAQPTTLDTESSSGLAVHVEVPNPGLENPGGISSSDLKDVKVALPQGMTINPSQASGLGVCSPAQYESSELSFHPDGQHGCPSDSKVGTVEVHTPLIEETIPGSVYVAKPYDNPFNSLLAIYIVLEEPQRGILVKLPGEIRLNETTGRIETEFANLPQVPFSSLDFHFREGARAPLVTPSTCGTYTTETTIAGWSNPAKPIVSKSSFEIVRGIGGGPCPPNGTPGFKPLFSAGSVNNSAAAFSPFNMRIQRNDGEQDMTRFSAVLPPGVLGKLAGVAKCPESAIAIAKAKSGNQEIARPSCPANSEIGHSIAGAGVGSVLTYVPGKVYLGGPFHGDPLSVIAITPAVAGPFDVGTVVVHEALTLNPVTAEVEVDGSASDPIPHILKGIPAKLRDLRVYVDRPDFILNPTSCDPSATDATLFGGGGNAFSTLDDVPVLLSDRYQAASCASLGFKPKLALNLKGGTKRGGHPGLTALYTPKEGNANIKGLTVRLPRSAFLDQAHIKTICTRVQFAAKACPQGAQYGYIKAFTPLLETPLEGPVYLRSSNHKLPDLVFDLHGLVDVEVAVRIDSQKGGIRATLESAPDAPLSKVVVRMQGAKKGLIINSRNLCGAASKANVAFIGHNGKEASANPVMKAECGGARGHKRHHD